MVPGAGVFAPVSMIWLVVAVMSDVAAVSTAAGACAAGLLVRNMRYAPMIMTITAIIPIQMFLVVVFIVRYLAF